MEEFEDLKMCKFENEGSIFKLVTAFIFKFSNRLIFKLVTALIFKLIIYVN